MQTVILAAGDGEGIEPLSASTPKPLLPVAGDPLVVHAARASVEAGATDLVVVVPPYHRPFLKALGTTFEGRPVTYAVQPRPTGTARALVAAERHLDEDFVVVPGDTLYDPEDLAALYEIVPSVGVTARSTGRDGAVLVGDGGPLEVDALADDHVGAYVDTGACSLPAAASDWTRVPRNDEGERDVAGVVERTADRYDVRPVLVDEYVDVDYPWDLLRATASVLDDWASTVGGPVVGGTLGERARLHGAVRIERGATVHDGAVVEGPAVVDENATVGPNARISAYTYIGPGVYVGHSASIERSVVMADATVERYSTVVDSVLGPDVRFGANTTVATLKHDASRDPAAAPQSPGHRRFGVVAGEAASTGVGASLHAGVTLPRRASVDAGADVLDDP